MVPTWNYMVTFEFTSTLENYTKRYKQHGFWLWDNNGLRLGHWQAQHGQLGEEGDGRDHGVSDFFSKV